MNPLTMSPLVVSSSAVSPLAISTIVKRFFVLAGVFSVSLGLSGCGGGGKPPWNDARYVDAMETGSSVFGLGMMSQAAGQYRLALQRALIADDAQEIHDAGFNLATAQLRAGDSVGAGQTLDRVEKALAVRKWTKTADLHLVRAAVFYRQKQWEDALREARRAQSAADLGTVEAAVLMEGLSAAELGDGRTVEAALAELEKAPKGTVAPGGFLELEAQQAYLRKEWPEAVSYAGQAAAAWRTAFDYPAMRRALSLQARALSAAGQESDAARIRTIIDASQSAQAKSQN